MRGWHLGDVLGQGWRLFTFSPALVLGQVLSHNLYTVLCIPHDPVALEEHFRDDDDGPVSSQGYMPYLNKYILDKVSSLVIPQTAVLHMRTLRFLGGPLSSWKSHALVGGKRVQRDGDCSGECQNE